MLQNQLKVELLRQAHGTHQVVGPVAMEMDRPLAFEYLHERVHRRVGIGWRRVLAGGLRLAVGCPLPLVITSLDELLALHGGELHARVGRHLTTGEVEVLGVLAVGHLQTAQDQHALDAHGLDGIAAQLDVERLSADDVAAAGHDVGGGDATRDSHADSGIVRENGVLGAQARLHGSGTLVAVRMRGNPRPSVDADVRVRIDQSGDDILAGGVDDLRVLRDGRVRPAHGDDLAPVDNKHAVLDGRAGDREKPGAAKRERGLGGSGDGTVAE